MVGWRTTGWQLGTVSLLCLLSSEQVRAAEETSLVAAPSAASASEAAAPERRGTEPAPRGTERAPSEGPTAGQRTLALGAAVVPGLLVHGSGSFVLGRKTTAGRLLLLQGVGLGLLGLGGTVIVATGAAKDFVGPAATLAIVGGGLFTLSALADFYSVLAPEDGTGRDPGFVPLIEAELGYRYVYDPQFDYRHFLVSGLHLRLDRWRLSPSLWSSPFHANQRFRAEAAYRFFGPTPDRIVPDGNFVEAEVAFTEHRFGHDDLSLTTFEGSFSGRWDLSTYDPYLAGAFLDFSVGLATQLHDFGAGVFGKTSSQLLLGGFGFGVYLGDQWPTGGFARVFYDHRHDGFAAGLLLPGIGSGAIGHFGAEGVYYLTRQWGVRAEILRGAALVTGVSGLFRFGGEHAP